MSQEIQIRSLEVKVCVSKCHRVSVIADFPPTCDRLKSCLLCLFDGHAAQRHRLLRLKYSAWDN